MLVTENENQIQINKGLKNEVQNLKQCHDRLTQEFKNLNMEHKDVNDKLRVIKEEFDKLI